MTGLGAGGAERQIENLVKHTNNLPSVIALYNDGTVADAIRKTGVPVWILGMANNRDVCALWRLISEIRRQAPDVVQVHLYRGQIYGALAAKAARVPVVISTEHSIMKSTIEGRRVTVPIRALYRVAERMTDATYAVSETTRSLVISWGINPRRVVVVPNGFDFETLRYCPEGRAGLRQELALSPDAKVIGVVGRLQPVKRLDSLLRAVAPLLRQPEVYLLIVGDGPEFARLQRLASVLGVRPRVLFLGDRDDVPELLSAMDVLVSTSRDETFGMAIVEALANGLPVVYDCCPALQDHPELEVDMAQRVDTGDAYSEEAMQVAITRSLSPANERGEVPAGLMQHYDIRVVAARLDGMHWDLWEDKNSDLRTIQ